MTPLVLLLTTAIIGVCNGLQMKMDEQLEESENLIEPRVNPWRLFVKPKGKSTLKNVIQSFQEFDTKKKMTSRKNKIEAHNNPESSSTEKINKLETSPAQIREGNLDKTNDKDTPKLPNSPYEVSFDKVFPSLHLQTEEKKKFIHSIIDGWSF